MNSLIKYRGRVATTGDVEYIKRVIADNPGISRWRLSRKLARAWNWVQPNGCLRDMVCRGFLLCLHRAGYIQLPARKRNPNNPLAARQAPAEVDVDRKPVTAVLSQLGPLEFVQVRRSQGEKLFNGLIQQYHYLGYCHPVGEHLKYLVWAQGRPIACFSWSSAPRHIGCRDRFIGWPAGVRRNNIGLIAYNSRFLILPWVRVRHPASHLLGRMVKIVPIDWQRLYHHPVYFLETFIDTEKFEGTCYRAANWIYLGRTTGRGKNDHTHKPNRSIKAVWGYPLAREFREELNRVTR